GYRGEYIWLPWWVYMYCKKVRFESCFDKKSPNGNKALYRTANVDRDFCYSSPGKWNFIVIFVACYAKCHDSNYR
ncbi:hypothetical protein, partial [Bacteroides pyogenes]|uniref:hypothetical protein n=1 Tax=Bacteroides pyogenes TaxID=310300 RepID=UPI001E2C3187